MTDTNTLKKLFFLLALHNEIRNNLSYSKLIFSLKKRKLLELWFVKSLMLEVGVRYQILPLPCEYTECPRNT